jgi:hypothetical protein
MVTKDILRYPGYLRLSSEVEVWKMNFLGWGGYQELRTKKLGKKLGPGKGRRDLRGRGVGG